MAKRSSSSTTHSKARPVNRIVDFVLGVLFLSLLAVFFCYVVRTYPTNPRLAQLVLGSCVVTFVGITSVRAGAAVVGRILSRSRSSDCIPADCRDPLASNVAMKKWQDQAWQLAIHLSMACWELRLIGQHPSWWADPRANISCPGSYAISAELEAFAVLQLTLWSFTGVSCKWFEERRKDYLEMMTHHVVTVALILTAQLNGEMAYALVVLAVHDVSDVFLDVMKMANYLKVEGSHGFFLTEIAFVINTYVAWPYLRLYVYPAFVIYGQFFGYQDQCVGEGWVPTINVTQVPLWITFRTSLLVVLFLLHIFWWYILNRIALKLAMGQSGHSAGDEEYEVTMKDDNQQKKASAKSD